MPGVRKAIVVDLPRRRLALGQHRALAERLRAEGYGQALVMPRTWKSALAPYLAGIPQRTGFVGEARFGLINDLRFGERRPAAHGRPLRCAGPAQGRQHASRNWPLPELRVPALRARGLAPAPGACAPTDRPVVAFAPGAVGPSKRWPYYAELARQPG